jgi:hypothetical protein
MINNYHIGSVTDFWIRMRVPKMIPRKGKKEEKSCLERYLVGPGASPEASTSFLGVKYIIRRFFTKISFIENLFRDPGSPKASYFAESDLESVYLDPKHWRLGDDIC